MCGMAAARDLASDGTLVICSTPASLRELATLLSGARTAGIRLGRTRRLAGPAALRLAWPALRGVGHRAPAGVGAAIAALDPGVRFALERTPGYRRRALHAAAAGGVAGLAGLAGEGTVLLV